jgi:PadR family transcriptional regulator PadR
MKGDHVGEFEELVLLSVQALGQDGYGVTIKGLLDRETRRDVSLGAVYEAIRGGRSRRSYALTPDGTRALREMRRVRERLWRTAPAKGRP